MADYAPSSAPNAIPPGWYADPLTAGQARWWSGQDWTKHVHDVPVGEDALDAAPEPAPRERGGTVAAAVAGVLAVVILTLVGISTRQPW